MIGEVVLTAVDRTEDGIGGDADPVVTEIIRQQLNSAADQMKRAVIRTAFSPIIYEALDFAVALYDADIRMLAQAPTLPAFMGTMGFCVDEAVSACGGPESMREGDVILYNDPFGTGSHPQDAALVTPVFAGGQLVGYSAIKAHWLDIGGKDPYCTDTIDVFQEGTIFPGVKLYDAGQRVDGIYRMVLANSRMPEAVIGDINAMIAGSRAGGAALQRIIDRHGRSQFDSCVTRMFANGEAEIRQWFAQLPEGEYVASSVIDEDGVTGEPIPFTVRLIVAQGSARFDLTEVPDQVAGPINCPLPSTIAGCRLAMSFLAGAHQPNEGHFRAVEVLTRVGSIFHPVRPAPSFMYGVPMDHMIELVVTSMASVLPDLIPASSGGDINALVWWGQREQTGAAWADGAPHPVGQGASSTRDGANAQMYHSQSATRFTPTEIWESRNPWLIEQCALAVGTAGRGRFRGGLGIDLFFRALEDCYLTSAVARTRISPWGLDGGEAGRPNAVEVVYADGRTERHGLRTRIAIPAGTLVKLMTASGGGHGNPAERDPALIEQDRLDGYMP